MGWWVGWLVGWLVGWWVGGLVGWWVGGSVGRLWAGVGEFAGWGLGGGLINRLVGRGAADVQCSTHRYSPPQSKAVTHARHCAWVGSWTLSNGEKQWRGGTSRTSRIARISGINRFVGR